METKKVKVNGRDLIFRNYKEPITPVKEGDGYGYYGVILSTSDCQKIQCHICGGVFEYLGLHVFSAHQIVAKDYKEKYGLSYGTALLSESGIAKQRNKTMAWIAKMTPEQMIEYRTKMRQHGSKGNLNRGTYQPKERLERKNLKGTCPQQLLAKVKEVVDKLGRVPTMLEFCDITRTQKYKHLIINTFGSYRNALGILGLKPKEPTKTHSYESYEDEELLEYLKVFVETNHRIPVSSDCRLDKQLPSEDTYKRHFGSLVKAREKAQLEDYLIEFTQLEKDFQKSVNNYQTN